MRLGSPLFLLYVVVGVLVATGNIGDERNYFSDMDTIEEVVEMLLAVFLWPLVLLGVDMNLGEAAGGGSGSAGK